MLLNFILYKEQTLMKIVYNRLFIIFLTFVHTITPSDNVSRSWNNNKQTISIIASGIVVFGLLAQYYFKNNALKESTEKSENENISTSNKESENKDRAILELIKEKESLTSQNNQLNIDNQLLKSENESLTKKNRELQKAKSTLETENNQLKQSFVSLNNLMKKMFFTNNDQKQELHIPLRFKTNPLTSQESLDSKESVTNTINELLTIFNLENEWIPVFNESRKTYYFQKKKK